MTDAMIKVKVLENQTDIILQKVLQKFCGMVHVLNPGQIQSTKIRNGLIFDEFEIGEVIDCVFTYYNKPYLLKCEIISISIAQNSQQTQSNTQISLRSNKESQKRVRPESCIIETPQLVKKNLNEKPTTSQAPLCSKDIMNFQSDDFANVNSDDEGDSKSSEEEINPNLDKSKKFFKIRKIKPKEKRQEIIIDLSRETDLENDYSVEKMIELSKEKVFPKKLIYIGNSIFRKTPILHFFQHPTRFTSIPSDQNLVFCCKLCKSELQAPFGRVCNLNQHLKYKHNDILYEWFIRYENQMKNGAKELDDKLFELVKWFIVTNESISQLKIPYFRNILDPSIQIPSYYHLRCFTLPNILNKVYLKIDEKLKFSSTICLVIDLWTNNSNIDFMACAAITTNPNFSKECFVIGMTPMPGSHSAENIRKALLNLLKRFSFNKKKIHSIVCDEGSNLVRLFSQIDFSIDEFKLYEESEDEQEKRDDIFMDENIYCEADSTQVLQEPRSEEIEGTEDQNEIYSITSTQNDIREIFEDLKTVSFSNPLKHSENNRMRIFKNAENLVIDEVEEYDSLKGEIISDFDIKIGDKNIPRYSCACHKANLAVRHAISMHPIGENLKILNASNNHVRKSIQLNKVFANKKSRLRIENKTRWSSAYLLLESVKRAYDKRLFDEADNNLSCTLSLKQIEIYLQILQPAYKFTISFQNNNSPISALIPSLFRIIYSWETMELEEEDERLATLLIVCFKQKFKFEIESEVYKAATVLNIGKINLWINKTFCQNVLTEGLRSLRSVYLKFFYEEKLNVSEELDIHITENQSDNDGDFLDELLKDDEALNIKNTEPEKFKINTELDKEIKYLTEILSKQEVLIAIKSNLSFWSKHQDSMPRLSRLAITLSNINASSAFIERFFSICGIICKKQIGNMNDDMIITRSILKSNIDILKELNQSLI